jgi:hypothetical protein
LHKKQKFKKKRFLNKYKGKNRRNDRYKQKGTNKHSSLKKYVRKIQLGRTFLYSPALFLNKFGVNTFKFEQKLNVTRIRVFYRKIKKYLFNFRFFRLRKKRRLKNIKARLRSANKDRNKYKIVMRKKKRVRKLKRILHIKRKYSISKFLYFFSKKSKF